MLNPNYQPLSHAPADWNRWNHIVFTLVNRKPSCFHSTLGRNLLKFATDERNAIHHRTTGRVTPEQWLKNQESRRASYARECKADIEDLRHCYIALDEALATVDSLKKQIEELEASIKPWHREAAETI